MWGGPSQLLYLLCKWEPLCESWYISGYKENLSKFYNVQMIQRTFKIQSEHKSWVDPSWNESGLFPCTFRSYPISRKCSWIPVWNFSSVPLLCFSSSGCPIIGMLDLLPTVTVPSPFHLPVYFHFIFLILFISIHTLFSVATTVPLSTL